MIYLDSNVFIYAASDGGPLGKAATNHLRAALQQGACTASLSADEVLWALAKKFDRAFAAKKVRQLLSLDLDVVAVESRDIHAALNHFDEGLDPRDAIHAAVALRRKCTHVVSSDEVFAKLKGIKDLKY